VKICAYVQEQYAKANYKNECLDTRQFVGLRVVIDAIERAGYTVEWAGRATVHKYDIVLVSLTSDCDWWSYIEERSKWQKGNYKVVIGGAGLLHITPFLPFADYFVWGRGENIVPALVKAIDKGTEFNSESVASSKTFSPDNIYRIAQVKEPYPHTIPLTDKRQYKENAIGCNHKCLFCGYTWHRKFISPNKYYQMSDSLFGGIEDKELAMLDYASGRLDINFQKLRTTAIDGFSERLRYSVNKKISDATLRDFLKALITSDAKPHQLKLYNLCGLPTETEDDWWELIEAFKSTECLATSSGKQWSIVLHTTPFRAMPATPMACAPMSYRDYRGEFGRILGKGLKGNIIYQGKTLWAVESMGTDSLSTVIMSAIAHRGSDKDTENIIKISTSKAFWAANGQVKRATLEKYFDVDRLFKAYAPDELPSRYLRTYAKVEKMW
jgi:hypothetical protein